MGEGFEQMTMEHARLSFSGVGSGGDDGNADASNTRLRPSVLA
jgi:hypothetical protein